jgi:hypothetical protein
MGCGAGEMQETQNRRHENIPQSGIQDAMIS